MSARERLIALNRTRTGYKGIHYPTRIIVGFTCALLATLGLAGWGSSAHSSRARPLPPGAASSITKDGITWTFREPVPVGQFVTGDYYVVGPVTITAIDPAPTTSSPYENGSVLNLPSANGKSGFDSRLNDGADESWWFDASLRVYPPITLKPGDALVSSISQAQIHSLPEVMRASDKSASPVGPSPCLPSWSLHPRRTLSGHRTVTEIKRSITHEIKATAPAVARAAQAFPNPTSRTV